MHRLRTLLVAARSDPFVVALAIVLVVAAVLRVAWVLYAARTPVGLHDPSWYALGAERIADGEGYTLLNGDPTAYYPVGYPAALAVVVWLGVNTPVTDDLPVAAGFAQVLLALVTVALVALIGRRLVSDRVGILAAAILAVFPSHIFYTATMLSETLFNLVLISAIAVLVWPRSSQLTWQRIGVAGVLLGVAVLTRPVALAVVPLVGVAWWIAHAGWRVALRQVTVLAGGVVLVVAPWTIRNTIRMGEPVVVSTNTGDNLCIGHNPEATGGFDLFDWCMEGVRGRNTVDDELHRDRTLTRRALTYVRENPHRQVPLLWWRMYYTFSIDDDGLTAVESYGDDPFLTERQRQVLATTANGFYFAVLALTVLGIGAFWRRAVPRRMIYLAFMAAMFVAPLPFFGDARFKLPFTVLCAVPAAIAVAWLPTIWRTAPRDVVERDTRHDHERDAPANAGASGLERHQPGHA